MEKVIVRCFRGTVDSTIKSTNSTTRQQRGGICFQIRLGYYTHFVLSLCVNHCMSLFLLLSRVFPGFHPFHFVRIKQDDVWKLLGRGEQKIKITEGRLVQNTWAN